MTSVDFDPQFKPTLCMNVLDLEPAMIEGNVDLIWASPLCTHNSRARTTARTPRDLEGSDALVRKCLDLADRLFCHYFIKNPESGLLKTRDVVARIPCCVVDYCVYADERFAHRARKRTAFWTNETGNRRDRYAIRIAGTAWEIDISITCREEVRPPEGDTPFTNCIRCHLRSWRTSRTGPT